MKQQDYPELTRYRAAIEQELQAWNSVASRFPGSGNFCPAAWERWNAAAAAAKEARKAWLERKASVERFPRADQWRYEP